ncbi:MAG: hypothetical protein IT427_09325 [Pirellulales bacterium]|nr:hypothetical protein [Pirellulales bacterium]
MANSSPFSLLDRFPAGAAGHIAFLEWVRYEVHYAADAKRGQLERGYPDATIESMVRGIKWAEASQRLSTLSDLPTEAVEQVGRVLRRELTPGTVEYIDELLAPAVRGLRDVWENREYTHTDRAADGNGNLPAAAPAASEAEPANSMAEPQEQPDVPLPDWQWNQVKSMPAAIKAAIEAGNTASKNVLLELAAMAGDQAATAAEATSNLSTPTKPKRSTERGEGRMKLIAALTKHHKYADGGCLNLEPIGNNELARQAGVSESTASEFFNKQFKGHTKYRAICADTARLVAAMKLLNQEFAPHHLFGAKPPGEDEREDDE